MKKLVWTVVLILPLVAGCQTEVLETVQSLIQSQGEDSLEEAAPRTLEQIMSDLRLAYESFQASSAESRSSVRELAKEFEEHVNVDDVDAVQAEILLNARTALYVAAPKENRAQLQLLCAKLSSRFAGQPLGTKSRTIEFVSGHDFDRPFEIQDFKELKAAAMELASPNDRALFYRTIARQLHASGLIQSSKLAIQLGLEHLKGQPGWTELFNEQFELGFKKAPPTAYGGGAFKTRNASRQSSRNGAIKSEGYDSGRMYWYEAMDQERHDAEEYRKRLEEYGW